MNDDLCEQLLNREPEGVYRRCFMSLDFPDMVCLGWSPSSIFPVRVRPCPKLILKLWKLL
jgi:hypothetical protein